MGNDKTDLQPIDLEDLGWSPFFQKHFQEISSPGSIPARVISESKNSFEVLGECGLFTAGIAGKMRHQDGAERLYPAVGDWVAVDPS